jgi:hypothetical protein
VYSLLLFYIVLCPSNFFFWHHLFWSFLFDFFLMFCLFFLVVFFCSTVGTFFLLFSFSSFMIVFSFSAFSSLPPFLFSFVFFSAILFDISFFSLWWRSSFFFFFVWYVNVLSFFLILILFWHGLLRMNLFFVLHRLLNVILLHVLCFFSLAFDGGVLLRYLESCSDLPRQLISAPYP